MAKAPNLNITVLGGTATMESELKQVMVPDDAGSSSLQWKEITELKRGKIRELLDNQVSDKTKSLHLNRIAVREAKVFLDSSDFDVDSLETSVYEVNRTLNKYSGSLVVVCGTDQVPLLIQNIVDGTPPDLLADRSIIVTVAQYASPKRPYDAKGPIDQKNSDAARNLDDAITVSADPLMQGQVGLCVNGVVYSARGSRKRVTEGYDPFENRYKVIAESDRTPNAEWDFKRRRNAGLPTGLGDEYKLVPGIEKFGLNAMSNYGNVLDLIHIATKKVKRILNGIIIPLPGSCNPRNVQRDIDILKEIEEAANESGIPVVLTSDPMQPFNYSDTKATYAGNAFIRDNKLIDGKGMMMSEVETVMSRALHYALKVRNLVGPDVISFVRGHINLYNGFVSNQLCQKDYIEAQKRHRDAKIN